MSLDMEEFAAGLAEGMQATFPLLARQQQVQAVFTRYLDLLKEGVAPEVAAQRAIFEVDVLMKALVK